MLTWISRRKHPHWLDHRQVAAPTLLSSASQATQHPKLTQARTKGKRTRRKDEVIIVPLLSKVQRAKAHQRQVDREGQKTKSSQ
jgi:hypothetical protein